MMSLEMVLLNNTISVLPFKIFIIEKMMIKKTEILDVHGIMDHYKKNKYFAKELTDYLYKRERFLEV